MAFIRSSNWPLYFVPATSAAKSSIIKRLSNNTRDTFRSTIRSANPSTIAVFPTPGSPIKIGLFFFLLLKICDTRSISSSLPTIGSRPSSSAILVISLPKLSKTGVLLLAEDRLELLFEVPPDLEPPSQSSSSSPSEANSEEISSRLSSSSSFTISSPTINCNSDLKTS